ncbi:cell adhesion molecule Dscam2-like isoform X2 [Palaemon carinicauda]|uniref:cell adhesion molecule Dscam2-like isoform X2 n=1 Tax=Palaemon carinicauda TaxID=392227 RepID=UPI0035B6A6F1
MNHLIIQGVPGVKRDIGQALSNKSHHNPQVQGSAIMEEPGRSQLRRPSRDLGLSRYPRPDSAPQLLYTPVEQTVSPGSPVSLKCSAQGSPTPVITWTRDHQPILTTHRTNIGSFRTSMGAVVSHVNLTDIAVRDGGLYTCTAHNALGSSAHSTRINVFGPPFVRAMPNVTAVAGNDVHLFCPAGGYPPPSITWMRDGQSLPTTLRQEMLTNGSLIVRNAGHGDVGRYSCVVSNLQGQTAASHTFLQILKPPEIDPFSFRHRLEEGRRTQVTCMVNAGDLPMTINWLKDGRHLQHDPDIESKQISEFSTVLLFKSLREHHSGSYTCEAANAAATVNHTAVLRVKVSPRWVVEPSGNTALVGSTVVIECSARGFPQPVITWKKAPGESAQDFQPVMLDGIRASQAPNGSMVLMDSTTNDAGWYLCQADNSIGKPISKVIQLTVHAPARVITEGGRVTGHAGQTVTISCEATGDLPLTLSWQRHHIPITPTHRVSIRETGGGGMLRTVLEIRSVTSGDAGTYTCRADNPHGHSAQIFTLAIIEPPVAPSDVTVSDVTSRSALLSWTLFQPAAVTIQYRAAEEESWAVHGRNVSVGQWASSHILTGLNPYKAYAVRLMAHNDLGVSQPSHMHVFTTLEEAPSGAPTDVQVAPGGPRSLVVRWRPPEHHTTHGPLRGYTLALRQQNLQGHLTYISRPATMSAGASGSEKYEVMGLSPASLYEVAVRAFNRAGPGPLSSPRIVQATGHDAPSCPPGGVSCRGSGRGGVRVWWSPPPTHCTNAPVSGYTILATPTTHLHRSESDNRWEVNTTNLEKNLDSLPPATNISVRVKAFNDVGASPPNNPVFCVTEDDVPGPPVRVRVIVTGSTSVLVTWSPPQPPSGDILHYTLYSARDDQVAVRDVVGAAGSEATWRELNNLSPATRVQVWVTATTVAGEGNSSPRMTAMPSATPKHAPIAVGGGQVWRVGMGAGVTLGCRGIGTPPPVLTWIKGPGHLISNGQYTQLLPGGDLHLTGVRESSNYTCRVTNSEGSDSLTHQVIVITTPEPPKLTLAYATYDSLNLSITPSRDGGAPILGYTLHHRGRAGEWAEMSAEPGTVSVVVRGLACGAPYHLYLTAWNTQGTSTPSPVLIANTQGKSPGRPEPGNLVEVNTTCVILRLYAWPEMGCPITHWKVDLGSEADSNLWQPLHSHVDRDTTDLGLCDLSSTSWHLLRLTAVSTAGETSVVYRVATRDHTGGSMTAESVQEVMLGSASGVGGWLDAHVVAGVVSALLLATALIICVCVAFRRRRYGGYRQGESLDNKGGGEDDNARNCEITRSHLYSPTPTKKPRGSLASLKTQDDTSDPYEICPYATFSPSGVPLSVGSSEATLEYGLSLHAMTPRDCLDHPAAHSDHRHALEAPTYGHASRQRSQSHYKETEIAYISNNRGRGGSGGGGGGGGGEYASRPKSISGPQPTPAPTPTPASGASEQGDWNDEGRKDTRGRPHRSRSRSRAETTRRDSSTESNDASSPVQQRQHYQHPQITTPHHHQHPQQLPPQHPQAQQQQQQQQPQPQQPQQQQQQPPPTAVVIPVAAGRGRPHPLPPVRLARKPSDSSSSDSSPMTPPRPLHPPSAFSDSRELSEAECDREIHPGQGLKSSSGKGRVRAAEGRSSGQAAVVSEASARNDGDIKAELTVLLQQYQQQHKMQKMPEKNPYSINV